MANTNNWGEIYKSTWWGDEDWSANSLKIDSAPPGFAGQNLLLGSEELQQSDEGEWERLNINAVDANVAGVANPLSSDETVEKIDFQASPTSRIIQDVTLVAGTQYTFSVWAKSAGASNEQFRLRYWDRTASSGGGDQFTALTTDWDATSGRYSFTFTAASSGVHAMHIQNSGSVQRRIYFWGAMLNEGATAGDYIKTTFIGPSSPATPPMEFGDNFVGVTAYYSLRRFTTGEDNNAIRVRRSSDDTEQDIGFDSNGDLDTTALLAFVGTQNLIYPSEDFGDASWDKQTGITATSNTSETTDPLGGSAAAKIVSTNASNGFYIDDFSFPTTSDLIRSIWLKGAVGGETVVLKDPSGYGGTTAVTLTTEWQRFTHSTSAGVTLAKGIFVDDISVGTIYAFGAQCNEGTTAATYNKTTTGIGGDGAVTTWYDQSGNGNNATNATASEQPLVVSAGTLVEENGKAAVDFDGVDDDFAISVAITAGLSIFGVYKNTKASSYLISTPELGRGGSNEYRFHDSAFSANGGTHSDSQVLLTGIEDDTNATIYANGTQIVQASSTFTSGTLTLIGSANIDGTMQELIIFDSDQSANRGTVTTGGGTGIEGNINTYFDIV